MSSLEPHVSSGAEAWPDGTLPSGEYWRTTLGEGEMLKSRSSFWTLQTMPHLSEFGRNLQGHSKDLREEGPLSTGEGRGKVGGTTESESSGMRAWWGNGSRGTRTPSRARQGQLHRESRKRAHQDRGR